MRSEPQYHPPCIISIHTHTHTQTHTYTTVGATDDRLERTLASHCLVVHLQALGHWRERYTAADDAIRTSCAWRSILAVGARNWRTNRCVGVRGGASEHQLQCTPIVTCFLFLPSDSPCLTRVISPSSLYSCFRMTKSLCLMLA
jgi:hypothetical protein